MLEFPKSTHDSENEYPFSRKILPFLQQKIMPYWGTCPLSLLWIPLSLNFMLHHCNQERTLELIWIRNLKKRICELSLPWREDVGGAVWEWYDVGVWREMNMIVGLWCCNTVCIKPYHWHYYISHDKHNFKRCVLMINTLAAIRM